MVIESLAVPHVNPLELITSPAVLPLETPDGAALFSLGSAGLLLTGIGLYSLSRYLHNRRRNPGL